MSSDCAEATEAFSKRTVTRRDFFIRFKARCYFRQTSASLFLILCSNSGQHIFSTTIHSDGDKLTVIMFSNSECSPLLHSSSDNTASNLPLRNLMICSSMRFRCRGDRLVCGV